ncbi:hypothetical protein ACQEV2_40825 [Streptomyces sp. CA-251387]|uniref:hypothetical protein n=1 Tax=Streptomyces sp. CA-251387 TaxID=3240064 RepID=UPI003D91AA25
MGPLVDKVVLSTASAHGGGLMEPGAQVVFQRGDLVLTYTIAGPRRWPPSWNTRKWWPTPTAIGAAG